MGHRYGIWYIDTIIYHIDMVILDIDMGYGLMIWEMTVLIRSSSVSIWDILSLCALREGGGAHAGGRHGAAAGQEGAAVAGPAQGVAVQVGFNPEP